MRPHLEAAGFIIRHVGTPSVLWEALRGPVHVRAMTSGQYVISAGDGEATWWSVEVGCAGDVRAVVEAVDRVEAAAAVMEGGR